MDTWDIEGRFPGLVVLAVLVGGCGGGNSQPTGGGGSTGTGGGAAGHAGSAGAAAGIGGGAGGGTTGQDGGSAGAGGAGVAPTVVATLGRVPASLALDGANLYVTLIETAALGDGQVVTLPKTSLAATLDAGAGTTTLASGLFNPRTIAADGATVYWADRDAGSQQVVFAVPTAGGSVTDVTGAGVYTQILNRIAIANNVLYAFTGNAGSITAFPLAGAAASAGQVIYPGPGVGGLGGIDSDGTSVFFLVTRISNTWDLSQIPVGGGTETVLMMSMLHGQAANDTLVHDATSIYGTDQATGNVYSLPKAGGTPKLLANFPGVSGNNLQIALDTNDIYVLEGQSLSRVPKTGGTPVVLASTQSTASSDGYLVSINAVALAVDDTSVYWLWEGHGQILKLAK